MTISQAYQLATDGEFRLLAGFTSPPRAGVVTALEAGGQVRVTMDDADGADVLAWPLNGFTYAVDDVVYVAFASDSPESGIVIGSKGSVPVLDSTAVRTALDAVYARPAVANTFTQEQSITEANSALYAGTDASHNAFLSIDNPSETAGTSAGIALKVENASGALQRWFMGLVSTANGYPRFVLKQRTGTSTYAERLAIGETGDITMVGGGGNVGVGIAPQGKLHVHDGSGGMMCRTVTGINSTTAKVMVADGTGDIVRGLAGQIVVTDGSASTANTLAMLPGDTLDVAVGSLAVRLELLTSGQLQVKRQSGTGSATVALLGVWL